MSSPSNAFLPAPARAIALVTLAYVVALAAAWATIRFAPPMHPLLAVFAADVVATIVVFGFSRAFDNSSFYDPYWSVAPMIMAAWLPFSGLPGVVPFGPRQALVLGVTTFWGGRLTYNWLRGWSGLAHEDWRYVDFRKQFPRGYWPFSFAAIHFFPTVCTFAGSLAMWPAATSTAPLGSIDYAGAAIAILATFIEGTADAQLRAFRADCAARGVSGAICEVGLWGWSRHPNYFGECTFWFGLWLLGVGASSGDALWTAVGPVGMVSLFVFGTIPLMEKRSLARRPAFADVQRRISMFVPWPPKKA
jgi:steroid 5-alpha reductase family enzyme